MNNQTLFKQGTQSLGDLASGPLGVASATIDICSSFIISPTVVGRAYTIPAPIDNTQSISLKIANNTIFDFTVAGATVSAGTSSWFSSIAGTNNFQQAGGAGGGVTTIQTVTATGSVTAWNYTVLADTTAGDIVLTLPDANLGLGKSIEIYKTTSDVNTVTIVGFAGDTVSAIDTLLLRETNEGRQFRATGTNTVQMDGSTRSELPRTATHTTGALTLSVNVDTYFLALTGAGAITVPLAASVGTKRWNIVKTDATAFVGTLTRSGADTINATTNFAMFTQNQVIILSSDGVSAYSAK